MKLNSHHLLLRLIAVLLLPSCLLFQSCDGDDEVITPKPRTYFRLTFPEKQYVKYSGDCPFSCEIPSYSKMNIDTEATAEPCWLNLDFPNFRGRLHLSYKPVNGNINSYLEQTYTMTSRHQIKASGIEEQLISKDAAHVYGLIYNVEGNAASSLQFFLTDSTRHFIRGALYFYAVPNTDSIKPVVEFIQKDIQHMIETFEWKESNLPSSGSSPKPSKSTSTANRK